MNKTGISHTLRLVPVFAIIFMMLSYGTVSSQDVGEAGIYFNQAEEQYQNKNYSGAIPLFQKSLDIMEKLKGDPGIRITIMNRIASSWYNLGEKEKALEYYKRGLDTSIKTGDYSRINSALFFCMNIYYELGRHAEGEKFADEKITKLDRAKLIPDIALFYDMWGTAHSLDKKYKEAISCRKKGLEIYTAIDNKNGMAEALEGIGNDYSMLENYKAAIDFYNRALTLAEGIYKPEDMIVLLQETGLAYSDSGNFSEAIKFFNRALDLATKNNIEEKIIFLLGEIAWQYREMDNFSQAAEYYRKVLEIYEKKGDMENAASILDKTGQMISSMERYTEALEYFNRAAEIYKENGLDYRYGRVLLSIASARMQLADYDGAEINIDEAYDIFQKLDAGPDIFSALLARGEVCYMQGLFSRALESFTMAEKYAVDPGARTTLSLSTGNLYFSWGNYDRATECFKAALKEAGIFEKEFFVNRFRSMCKTNMAMVKIAQGKHAEAAALYREAMALTEKTGSQSDLALLYNGMGSIYFSWGKYDDAMKYFEKAAAIFSSMNAQGRNAVAVHNIGLVYFAMGMYDDAQAIFEAALSIAESTGETEKIAAFHDTIGITAWFRKDYGRAEEHLLKSIEIKERLRTEVAGENRRDYLASQVNSYRVLASTYIRRGEYEKAFDTVELSSAKYMMDLMKSAQRKEDFEFEGAGKFCGSLDDTTAVIRFSDMNIMTGITVYVADKSGVRAWEISLEDFIKAAKKKTGKKSARDKGNERGIEIETIPGFKSQDNQLLFETGLYPDTSPGTKDFAGIINRYRELLSISKLNASEKEEMKFIASSLYALLFSAIEERLKGKTEIILIPDGVLGIVPFETLIMPDGRYMVEQYGIKYTQSLTVLSFIRQREYSPKRKPVIAFGGALYDRINYSGEQIKSSLQLENFAGYVRQKIEKGELLGEVYYLMGISGWDSIPGTLDEVSAIDRIISGSEIISGSDVNEGSIKSLSKKGNLKKYKIIHFACHGIAMPGIPALSALVLSQQNNTTQADDGYLTLNEILQLDINADFVNLSACETGLGRIYNGEGVVGLTQSFIIAGANSMSVSLWQVNDISTMEFMTGLYEIASREKSPDYSRAMTEMKRKFISGNRSEPYYWAPFVYYGE